MIEEIDEKSKWINKIKKIEKIKDEFIGMGPIKSSQNNELWKEFKSVNKEFINKKNLFFKNLKKTYSDNIKKQINLIEEIKKLKDSKKINISDLQNLKSKFKNIKNVPFKRNKENWNLFLDVYNSCFNQIDELKNEKSQKDKEILDKKNNLIEDLKNDFSLEKINTITDEWAKIDNKNSSKELTGLISLVTQQLKLIGLTKNEIEANILKIKSKLIDDSRNIKLEKSMAWR